MPICNSTMKRIAPDDVGATSFLCPNCGEEEIHRSSMARKFSSKYKCSNCEFIGP